MNQADAVLDAAPNTASAMLSNVENAACCDSTEREFLAFTLGQQEYGIRIRKVQELRGYENVTAIVNAPAFIKGMVNLRGAIVPIIDMRIKFGVGSPTYDQFTVVVVVNLGSLTIGLVVDSVSDVVNLTPDQLKPAPEAGAAFNTDYLIGLGTLDRRMIMLLDIEALMVEAGLVFAPAA